MSSGDNFSDSLPNFDSKLIGSSKRKRKSVVVKRSIKCDEKLASVDAEEIELEKSLDEILRSKSDKKNSTSDDQSNKQERKRFRNSCNSETDKMEETPVAKDEDGKEEVVVKEETVKKKKILKGKETNVEKNCENCSLCSEHKPAKPKEENEDKKGKYKFVCQSCEQNGVGKFFSSVAKMRSHIKTMHEVPKEEEVKRFQCKECTEPTWYTTKAKFCYHLGAKHPGVILFVCDICTETFKLKANYKNHIATHNVVVKKKFSCDVCNGTFVNKAGFEAHKKRFPGPHIQQCCVHCGFSFSREKHLKNHRCKKLLLEEAARLNSSKTDGDGAAVVELLALPEATMEESPAENIESDVIEKEDEMVLEEEHEEIIDEDGEQKKLVLHKLTRKTNRAVYRPVPVQIQTQEVTESMIVHEYREVEFDKESIIGADPEQQIIVQDVTTQYINTNQILQFDINDVTTDESQQVFQDANRLHLFLWDDESKRQTIKKACVPEEQ